MLGNLKDIKDLLGGGGLEDASDLISTLGRVATKAKPVKEQVSKDTDTDDGGLLGALLGGISNRPTQIRLVILDAKGKKKRDLSLPISILKAALGMGAEALNLDEKYDPDKLILLLETRNKGLLFDFDDPTDGDKIKIYLE